MAPVVEGRNLVIKVKYGDLLKRFGACVHGNSMDHDMNKLRRKIIDLFKFSPHNDIILKYVDEDGDAVLLDNDDELRDAVITQRLNPLIINVHLKSDIAIGPDNKQVEQQPLKCPVDSLFNGFNKDPLDFLTRALPPLVALPELMGTFANIGFNISQTNSNSTGKSLETSGETAYSSKNASVPGSTSSADPLSVQLQCALSQAAVEFVKIAISIIAQVPNNTACEPSGMPDEKAIKPTHLPEEELKPSKFSAASPMSSVGVPVHFQKRQESVNLNPGGSGMTNVQFPDLNLDACEHSNMSNSERFSPNDGILSSDWASKKNVDYDGNGNRVNCYGKSVMHVAPLSVPVQKVDEQSKDGIRAISFPSYGDGISSLMNGGKCKMSTNTTMYSAKPDFCFDGDASVNHHIGSAVTDLHIPSTIGLQLHGRSHRKNQGYIDSHTFHLGVGCDGCRMYPVVGPRFKSKVKEDYDLCSTCLSRMGNEADYIRIDKTHPLSSHRILKEYKTLSRRKIHPHLHGIGLKYSRVKLESCFVQDVSILDGTVMPPSVPFTKIWRMRNNGSLQWPYGTQLEWVGGDQFSIRRSVKLEEIDIAADFVSPSMPGNYISYWRLTSPSGQKFGQQVWVLIQVVVPYSSNGYLNLNLPPEAINSDGLDVIDANSEPLVGAPFEPYVNGSDVLERFGDQLPVGNKSLKPFVNQVTAGNVNLQPSGNQVQSGTVNVESVDIPPAVNSLPYPPSDIPFSPPEKSAAADVLPSKTETDSVMEQTLLKELEDMGFKQFDMSKEILWKNSYNLEQTLEDSDNSNVNLQPSENQGQSGSVNVKSVDNENPHDIAHSDNSNVVAKPIPAVTTVSSPLLDIPPAVNPLSYPPSGIPLSPPEESATADLQPSKTDSVVEQTLLKELEYMGFKHFDLNKEILRKNGYNLEQTLEDLCGITEWDLLLEELQDMGFCDRSKNKELLVKNGGSIKQAVLDLIAEENK